MSGTRVEARNDQTFALKFAKSAAKDVRIINFKPYLDRFLACEWRFFADRFQKIEDLCAKLFLLR